MGHPVESAKSANNFSEEEVIEEKCKEIMFASILEPELEKEAVKTYVEYLHKIVEPTFSGAMKKLNAVKLISDDFLKKVLENAETYDSMVDPARDLAFDYSGLISMKKNYILCIGENACETPQYVYMRIAAFVSESIEQTAMLYEEMSRKRISFATPIMANSGTNVRNLNSCFLVAMSDDSILGIYETLKDLAILSQKGGGIGMHVHNIRSAFSLISSTGKAAGGIIPMLGVYDKSAGYVDQGGRRRGAVAVYVETHNPELLEFLESRKPNAQSDSSIKNLFPAIWISDLFMKRVEADGMWSFFDSYKYDVLNELYGPEYEKKYIELEAAGLYTGKQRKARYVMEKILLSIVNSGLPYIVSKDRVNRCSNHSGLGTIRSSNLCTEIVQYSAPDEISCCTLASIVLSSYVVPDPATGKMMLDRVALDRAMAVLVESLDHIIDLNDYSVIPGRKTETSAIRHRPLAIGLVGVADALLKMRMVYGEKPSLDFIGEVAEQMYWSALNASSKLAEKKDKHITFSETPLASGQFHFELWMKSMREDLGANVNVPLKLDWESLRARIIRRGVRNSLLIGLMPTGTTSQVLGAPECFEPYTSNAFARRIGAGEIVVINKYLVADLQKLGVWNESTYKKIVASDGSIGKYTHFETAEGNLVPIPVYIRSLYRTVYEVGPRRLNDFMTAMVPFIDQSASKNNYYSHVSPQEMGAIIFHSWKSGHKTLQYYGRNNAAEQPMKVMTATEQPICAGCST